MADHIVPHFHNDAGVPVIEIGAHEFMCVGAKPPFDHPHVFLDMGDENEIICPYCSTLYRLNPKLDPHDAIPADCALRDAA
ncbi:MAG TPA: zinc-finger domain-containing protein [Xanthobacteraceae bacterium]|nr:zinc-finger domain-containing protein [Xanthobacteraceae bacterium]